MRKVAIAAVATVVAVLLFFVLWPAIEPAFAAVGNPAAATPPEPSVWSMIMKDIVNMAIASLCGLALGGGIAVIKRLLPWLDEKRTAQVTAIWTEAVEAGFGYLRMKILQEPNMRMEDIKPGHAFLKEAAGYMAANYPAAISAVNPKDGEAELDILATLGRRLPGPLGAIAGVGAELVAASRAAGVRSGSRKLLK